MEVESIKTQKKGTTMTDKDILQELIGQRTWWEKQKEKKEAELSAIRKELSKVSRLIELLEPKIHE